METRFLKRALIREPGYPAGFTAPVHVECECGRQVPVPLTEHLYVTCPCGVMYDRCGWIVTEAHP